MSDPSASADGAAGGTTPLPRRPSPLGRFAVHFIETYRRDVAHRLNVRCTLRPTCSEYALDAYRHRSAVGATVATVRRLRACRRAA